MKKIHLEYDIIYIKKIKKEKKTTPWPEYIGIG